MNVEIGAEAAHFPEKEYINGIYVAVYSLRKEVDEDQSMLKGRQGSVISMCRDGRQGSIFARRWTRISLFQEADKDQSVPGGRHTLVYARRADKECALRTDKEQVAQGSRQGAG
jgi:hypothetical protein